MSYAATATYSASSLRAVSAHRPSAAVRRPIAYPAAILAARANSNSARILVRSQYAMKPLALVAFEYAIVAASMATAIYLTL